VDATVVLRAVSTPWQVENATNFVFQVRVRFIGVPSHGFLNGLSIALFGIFSVAHVSRSSFNTRRRCQCFVRNAVVREDLLTPCDRTRRDVDDLPIRSALGSLAERTLFDPVVARPTQHMRAPAKSNQIREVRKADAASDDCNIIDRFGRSNDVSG